MPPLLYAIIVAALLSSTSLIAILLRISPLTSTAQALPAFLASIFLTIATVGSLLLFLFWTYVPIHTWNEGKILGIALRQGIFLALAIVIILVFHLLYILTWWIAILIFLVFILIEMALER